MKKKRKPKLSLYRYIQTFVGGEDDARNDLAIELADDRNFPRNAAAPVMRAYLARKRDKTYLDTFDGAHREWLNYMSTGTTTSG